VIERNQADSTFGWGIVFSDKTMDGFRADDPQVVAEIERNFHHWDNATSSSRSVASFPAAMDYCGIGRLKLLQIFQARARELGRQPEVRDRIQGSRRLCPGIRSGHRRRWRQFIDASQVRRAFQSAHRRTQVPLHLARHQD
jgi:hypothetical protein